MYTAYCYSIPYDYTLAHTTYNSSLGRPVCLAKANPQKSSDLFVLFIFDEPAFSTTRPWRVHAVPGPLEAFRCHNQLQVVGSCCENVRCCLRSWLIVGFSAKKGTYLVCHVLISFRMLLPFSALTLSYLLHSFRNVV